jgi:hypothetical protein
MVDCGFAALEMGSLARKEANCLPGNTDGGTGDLERSSSAAIPQSRNRIRLR